MAAKKHLTIFPVRERRKNLPLSERSQITIGEYIYVRSRAVAGSPLYGKWYKKRKNGTEIEIVDYPPVSSF